MDVTQVAAFGALITGLLAAWLNFRKAPAEREALTIDTMDKVMGRMQSELDRAYALIEQQERMIDDLKQRVAALGG